MYLSTVIEIYGFLQGLFVWHQSPAHTINTPTDRVLKSNKKKIIQISYYNVSKWILKQKNSLSGKVTLTRADNSVQPTFIRQTSSKLQSASISKMASSFWVLEFPGRLLRYRHRSRLAGNCRWQTRFFIGKVEHLFVPYLVFFK